MANMAVCSQEKCKAGKGSEVGSVGVGENSISL